MIVLLKSNVHHVELIVNTNRTDYLDCLAGIASAAVWYWVEGRCGRTATVAWRARTSSRKRLLLGFCSGLVPFGSFAAALTAKSGRALPTCVLNAPCSLGGVPHLNNLRPNQMPLRVDCKAPHGAADYPQQKP
jgi:hypothetical protein